MCKTKGSENGELAPHHVVESANLNLHQATRQISVVGFASASELTLRWLF